MFIFCLFLTMTCQHLSFKCVTYYILLHLAWILRQRSKDKYLQMILGLSQIFFVVVVALLFYVHGKHLRSCQDGQLT